MPLKQPASTRRCWAPTAWSARSTGARSTGSGATPTGRPTRWAISTCPGPPPACRGDGGLDPEVGIDLTTSSMTRASPGRRDARGGADLDHRPGRARRRQGRERMFAGYVKMSRPSTCTTAAWPSGTTPRRSSDKVAAFDAYRPVPQGHPSSTPAGGIEYVYFAHPYPLTRVRADPAALPPRAITRRSPAWRKAARRTRGGSCATAAGPLGVEEGDAAVDARPGGEVDRGGPAGPTRCCPAARRRDGQAGRGPPRLGLLERLPPRWVMIAVSRSGHRCWARSGTPRPTRRSVRGCTPARW